jgi:hypothetical protein
MSRGEVAEPDPRHRPRPGHLDDGEGGDVHGQTMPIDAKVADIERGEPLPVITQAHGVFCVKLRASF